MIYCEVSDFSFINLPSPVKSTPIEIGNMIKPPKPGSGINVQNYLPAPIITSYDSSYIPNSNPLKLSKSYSNEILANHYNYKEAIQFYSVTDNKILSTQTMLTLDELNEFKNKSGGITANGLPFLKTSILLAVPFSDMRKSRTVQYILSNIRKMPYMENTELKDLLIYFKVSYTFNNFMKTPPKNQQYLLMVETNFLLVSSFQLSA